jgi:hypothetical protein
MQPNLGRWAGRVRRGKRIAARFQQKLAEFRDAIKAVISTTDPEQRKKLPVPWEYTIWIRCRKANNALPFSGGVLEQPHILMHCLDLIDAEIEVHESFKRKLEERNHQLKENK